MGGALISILTCVLWFNFTLSTIWYFPLFWFKAIIFKILCSDEKAHSIIHSSNQLTQYKCPECHNCRKRWVAFWNKGAIVIVSLLVVIAREISRIYGLITEMVNLHIVVNHDL